MRVRYAPQAQLDIASIYNHIVVRNPGAAQRVEDYIRAAIEMLATFPGLGVTTDEDDVRRLPPGRFPYTVFYQVDEPAGAGAHIARDPCRARTRSGPAAVAFTAAPRLWPGPRGGPSRRASTARASGRRRPAAASMRPKRRMNFWLADRSAPSGSIFRWRATLATTNSRSPNSSSISIRSARLAAGVADAGGHRLLQLGELLLELVEHGRQRRPVEADAGGFVLQLDGARERREGDGNIVEHADAPREALASSPWP